MKRLLLTVQVCITLVLLIPNQTIAQGVAINNDGSNADNSAMLDVKSTNSGMLIPRMTQAQRNTLSSPAASLIIFQTDNTPGYYYNSGTPASPVWERLATGSDLGFVDGSGVATRVAFWQDANTLSSSANLYWDDTNGRLGIGTASPSTPLYINASAHNGTALIVDRYSSGGVASIQAGPSNEYLMLEGQGTTGKVGINFYSSGHVLLAQGGGNVGIGTTSPSTKLHVNGTVRFQGLGTGTQTTGLMIDASGNVSGRTLNIANWDDAYSWGDHAAEGYLTNFSEVDPTWSGTANTTSTIGRTGSVGIGTTSPTYPLEVTGDIYANGGWMRVSGNQGIFFQTHGGGFYMTDATWIRTYNNKSFYQNTGTMRTDGTFQVGASGATLNVPNGGNFAYRTNVLFANTAGNVGVGTVSPSAKLDVNGTVKAESFAQNSDGLRITSPGGASFVTSTSSITGAIKISLPQYRSSTMMRMTIKVYQYTTDKSYTIELGGYNYVSGDWYNTFANIDTRLGDNLTVRFGHDGTNNCIWIGETTSTWSYPQVFVTEFQAGYSNYGIDQWDNGWDVAFVTSFNTVEEVANTAYTPSGTGTTNYLAKWLTPSTLGIGSVYDNGNVGIGTSSPSQKLDVSGNIRSTGNYYINNTSPTIYLQDNDHRAGMIHMNSNLLYFLSSNGNNSTTWATNGSYWPLTINMSNDVLTFGGAAHFMEGNVGVGTTTPSELVHVSGGSLYANSNSGEWCELADNVWEGSYASSDSDDGAQGYTTHTSYSGVRGDGPGYMEIDRSIWGDDYYYYDRGGVYGRGFEPFTSGGSYDEKGGTGVYGSGTNTGVVAFGGDIDYWKSGASELINISTNGYSSGTGFAGHGASGARISGSEFGILTNSKAIGIVAHSESNVSAYFSENTISEAGYAQILNPDDDNCSIAYSIISDEKRIIISGSNKFINGASNISFNGAYTQVIDFSKPITVSITPTEIPDGFWAVTDKSQNGISLKSNSSDFEFDYIIVAELIDNKQIPEIIKNIDLRNQINSAAKFEIKKVESDPDGKSNLFEKSERDQWSEQNNTENEQY